MLRSRGMTEVLLTGLKIGESARWHDGRLWLANWGAQQILAVDLDGKAEVMATVPTTMPFSIDWLPAGGVLGVAVAGSGSTAAPTSIPTRARRPGSSPWSRRTARSGGSRRRSRFPTGWRSPRAPRPGSLRGRFAPLAPPSV